MRYYAKLKSSIKPELQYSKQEGFKITNQRRRKIIGQGSAGKSGRTHKEYFWEVWVTVLGNHLKFENVFKANYEFIELIRIMHPGIRTNLLKVVK